MAGSRLLRAGLVVASIAAASASCKKKEAPPTPTVAPEAPPEAPVPAPDGLTVEAIVRSPDAIVQSFHAIHPILPDKAAPILADLLHLTRETTEEVEGTKGAYFVLARRGTESLFVLALPVRDATKVLAALSKQGFSRSEDPSQQLSIFEAPPDTKGPRSQVIGLRRKFLLAASSVTALKELAPFATRTMPTRALPKEDVAVTIPQAAVRGPLKDALRAALDAGAEQRKALVAKAKASAGDAGPKGAPVGALDAIGDYSARQNERVVSWLADAGDAHVTLTTQAGALSIRADVDIAAQDSAFGKQVGSWPVGDAAPALTVPAGALVAFVTRASETARVESSKDIVEMLSAMFPDDVGAAEKTKLEAFLAAWDKARGELTTGALLYEGPARLGIAARLGAKDAPALSKLLKEGLTAILSMKGVASGLTKEGIGTPSVANDKIGGVDVHVLSLKLPHKPGEKPKPGEPETADVVWGALPASGEVALVAGVGSRDLFAKLVDKSTKPLQSFPQLDAHAKALGAALAGAAFVMPSRIVPLASGTPVAAAPPPDDAVVVGLGRGAKGPFLAIDVSRGAVELAGKLAMRSLLAPKL